MSFVLAIFPPLLIAFYIYKQDKFDKEPKELILKSFLFGCLSVIPIAILELIFNENLFSNLFIYMFCGVALVEEGMKYFFLKKYLFDRLEFNEPLDGIVYGVMVSLGFATIENLVYVYLYYPDQQIYVATQRMLSAIPLHASCGVIMGYYVGLAKFSSNSRILLLKGVFFATLLHAIYNYFIFSGNGIYSGLSVLALILGIYLANKAIKIHQLDSQIKNNKDEVIY
tara:strand:- start:310 stop:987 length:678 start_codon:yes stop_codon:yes gene_type:complete